MLPSIQMKLITNIGRPYKLLRHYSTVFSSEQSRTVLEKVKQCRTMWNKKIVKQSNNVVVRGVVHTHVTMQIVKLT